MINISLWGIEILTKKKDIAFSLLNQEKQEFSIVNQIENKQDKKMINYRRKIKGEYTTKVVYK